MAFPDYSFTSYFLELAGVRMHYLDEGPTLPGAAGEPIVMLHGNPTWSFYFRRLITPLRERFRCIVPDHIGMGLSDKPAANQYDYTLDRRVADLEALLDHLGVRDDITLILHDWGGMIGSAFATKYPQRIKRLVILNTGAFHLPKFKPLPWQLKLCRSPLGPLLVRGFNLFARDAVKSCVTRRPLPPEVKRAFLAPYNSWKNRVAVLRFVQDIPLKPGDRAYETVSRVESSLHRLADKPMLICWGMRDFVFDAHFLREWEKHFPSAQVHRFEDAGHYILEDAHEQIVPLVERFLE